MNMGDGVIIEYFDNEIFMGESKKVENESLNFLWNGEAPVEGINPVDFSAM